MAILGRYSLGKLNFFEGLVTLYLMGALCLARPRPGGNPGGTARQPGQRLADCRGRGPLAPSGSGQCLGQGGGGHPAVAG